MELPAADIILRLFKPWWRTHNLVPKGLYNGKTYFSVKKNRTRKQQKLHLHCCKKINPPPNATICLLRLRGLPLPLPPGYG